MRASVLGRDAALADLDTMLAIVRDVHPDPSPRFAVLRDSLAQAWPTSITRARLWTDLSRVLASSGRSAYSSGTAPSRAR